MTTHVRRGKRPRYRGNGHGDQDAITNSSDMNATMSRDQYSTLSTKRVVRMINCPDPMTAVPPAPRRIAVESPGDVEIRAGRITMPMWREVIQWSSRILMTRAVDLVKQGALV